MGVFGITVVSNLLSAGQNILQIMGGILILLFGVGVLCKKKAAAFAAFGIRGGLDAGKGAVLIIGIFIGTLCWWLALSGITTHFRDKVTGKMYRCMNYILGCFMIGFGILMAVRGLRNGL